MRKFSAYLHFIIQFLKFLVVPIAGKVVDSNELLTGMLEDAVDSPPGHDKSDETWQSEALKLDDRSPPGPT